MVRDTGRVQAAADAIARPHGLFNLVTNGVEIVTGRTVFIAMGELAAEASCPTCSRVVVWEELEPALAA